MGELFQPPYDWEKNLWPGDIIDLDMCDDTVVFTPGQLDELHEDLDALWRARQTPWQEDLE